LRVGLVEDAMSRTFTLRIVSKRADVAAPIAMLDLTIPVSAVSALTA